MFTLENISQLIWYAHSIAYPHIHIIVRMTIYPKVDTAIPDIIFQFYNEGSVSLTIGKLGTLHLERRYMMSDNNLFPGVAGWNGFFQKRKAPCVLTIKVCKREKLSIEEDASEVAYDLFRIVCLLQGNLRPQSCYDEVDVFYVYCLRFSGR